MTGLTVYKPTAITTSLDLASMAAQGFREASKAEATRKAYGADWLHFTGWCRAHGLGPLPASPEIVSAYLSHLAVARKSCSTIGRRLAAIRAAHRAGGHPVPKSDALSETLSGIRRSLGTAARQQKSPATAAILGDVLAAIGSKKPIDIRDRALLALGFAGAFRRSELVALDLTDIEFCSEGCRITIRRSKTDQTGAGTVIGIPLGNRMFPVAALRAWLDVAGITEGPIFRRITRGGRVTAERLDGRAVANIVKQRLAHVGLESRQYSGHSLRSGFVTSAVASGANLFRIMDTTRHKQLVTLKLYDRAKLFEANAGEAFL